MPYKSLDPCSYTTPTDLAERTTTKMASEASKPVMKDSGLGPLIRMRPLASRQLPAHQALPSAGDESRPDIHAFASAALEEGNAFMTTYLPHKFSVKSSAKWSPPSNAPVKLLAHDISASELPKDTVAAAPEGASVESWFARESLHENKAQNETASWEEFDNGLRVNHSQHEMEYTPGVQDAHEVMNWDEELEKHGRKIGEWEDVHASVMEMVHKIPAPLNNRVFPVLVITGKKAAAPAAQRGSEEAPSNAMPGDSFVVVQIPVGTQGLPGAKYHNVPKVTGGLYCSIERVEVVEDGKKVQWSMATASDAKGVLPMWAQKMGVPGAVVKDVGWFMLWVEERRKKGKV